MPTYYLFGKPGTVSPTYTLLTKSMKGLDNWKLHSKNPDYSNNVSRLSTFGKTKRKIVGKVFLARLLKNKHYFPKTWVISGSDKKNIQTSVGKYFLKPDMNYGGKGIKILSNPNDYKKYINNKSKYVLQKGVDNLLLYNGHKFDLRVWVYLIYRKDGKIEVYLHKDAGYLRISKSVYNESSTHPNDNLTNNSWQDKVKSNNIDFSINQLWTEQTYYGETYPKVKIIAEDVMKKLLGYWKRPDKDGFEIMGFDFLLDKELNPYLL